MSRFKDSGFIFKLGYVLAIYFAFIFVYILFSRAFTALYFAIVVLVPVTVFLFYLAYRRRQVFAFFIGFTIIGLLLFSLSTAVALPYTVTESHTYTFSQNLYNGTFTLAPSEPINISLLRYNIAENLYLSTNGTIVQLKFSKGDNLPWHEIRVKLYYRWGSLYKPEQLGLNELLYIGSRSQNIYWTPKGPIEEGWPGWPDHWLRVSLENEGSTEAQVVFKADNYDFTATSDKEVTKYRSAIDPYFGYLGLGLIIAAVIIEFWAWPEKWRKSKPPTNKN